MKLFTHTQLLTLLAFLGLTVGTLDIFYWSQPGGQTRFHEVLYQPAAVASALLEEAATANRQGTLRLPGRDALNADSALARRLLDTEMAVRRYGLAVLPDSQAMLDYLKGVLFVNADRFRLDTLDHRLSAVLHDSTKTTVAVPWVYHLIPKAGVKGYPALRLEGEVPMPVRLRSGPALFRQQPGFALWIFLLLVQWGLYVPLLVVVFATVLERQKTFSHESAVPDRIHWFWKLAFNVLLAAAITGGAAALALNTFSKERIVTNGTFFTGLDLTFRPLFAVGYALAILCFAGYLSIAGFTIRIRTKAAQTGAAAPPAEYEHKLRDLKRFYLLLNAIAGLVLSLSVLAAGVLFSSIGKMGFVQKLSADLGYALFPADLVYLYGALHSVLLLLFFVPARLNIARLQQDLAGKNLIAQPAGGEKGFDAWGLVKQLALGASPLLAGILQQVLDAVSNG